MLEGHIHMEFNILLMLNSNLVGYKDSDWNTDIYDHKSTPRYIFHLGSGPIFWSSKKQVSIALSFAVVDYSSFLNYATAKYIWIQNILYEFSFQQEQLTLIWCDN